MAGRPRNTNKEKNENKDIEKETIIEEEKIEMPSVEEVKPKRLSGRMRVANSSYDLDRLDKTRKVPVISVKNGTVGYKCVNSLQTLIWRGYGDEHTMTIEELLIMFSQYKKYITEPWLLVDDEEFAEVLRLTEMYQAIFDTENLEEFYKGQLISIKRKLSELPSGVRKELINRTVVAINSGELNNLAVVKLLKQEYDIDVEVI